MCGYDDELFQAWNGGKIGEKDCCRRRGWLLTLELCERWRAEQDATVYQSPYATVGYATVA